MLRAARLALGLTISLVLAIATAAAQQAASRPTPITNEQRQVTQQMLTSIQDELLHNYYDPTFHGLDMKARYATYAAELKQAPTLGAALVVIANYVLGLHDSHTYFLAPLFSQQISYGISMQMVGVHCLITDIDPESDAACKIHRGDEVLKLDGVPVSPANFRDLLYDVYALQPRRELVLTIRDAAGTQRQLVLRGQVKPNVYHSPVMRFLQSQPERWKRVGGVFIWQLPDFDGAGSALSRVYEKAQGASAIVLDLRGNPGGNIDNVTLLLGYFLDHKITEAIAMGRRRTRTILASPHGETFKGKLFVLMDNDSASGAELFARNIQLQHLGTVIGDRSAGALAEASIYPLVASTGPLDVFPFPEPSGIDYGVAVTTSALLMSDGKSLENTGVTPDIQVTPTPDDLAANNDPVLAHAVILAGGSLTPAAAGKLWQDARKKAANCPAN